LRGATPLAVACMEGRVACAAMLLQAGAACAPLDDGATPTYLAAQNGHSGCLQLLLERSTRDVKTAMNCGRMPLAAASKHGRTDCVRLLIAASAEVRAKEEGGGTARELALKGGFDDIAELLRMAEESAGLRTPIEAEDVCPDAVDGCAFCADASATLRCAKCVSDSLPNPARYCNRQCQKSHWRSVHKQFHDERFQRRHAVTSIIDSNPSGADERIVAAFKSMSEAHLILIGEALELKKANECRKAAKKLTKAIIMEPREPRAFYELAVLYNNEGTQDYTKLSLEMMTNAEQRFVPGTLFWASSLSCLILCLHSLMESEVVVDLPKWWPQVKHLSHRALMAVEREEHEVAPGVIYLMPGMIDDARRARLITLISIAPQQLGCEPTVAEWTEAEEMCSLLLGSPYKCAREGMAEKAQWCQKQRTQALNKRAEMGARHKTQDDLP